MNKAETVKQLAKQTIEREQDLRACLLSETREIKKAIQRQTQQLDTLNLAISNIQNKRNTMDSTPIIQELLATKKEYRKMRALIVICFLTVLVPFLAILAAFLIRYLMMK